MQAKNQEKNYYSQASEINLVDMWLIICKRKWYLIVTLLICLIIAGFYIGLTPRTYESKAVINIGKVGNVVIEDKLLLVRRLKEQYRLDDNRRKQPLLYSVKAEDTLNIIMLAARGTSALKTQQYLKTITDNLLQKHSQLFLKLESIQRKRLDRLSQELNNLNSKIDLFEREIRSNKGRDATSGALLALEGSSLNQLQLNVEQRLIEQEMLLSELNTRPTKVLLSPTLEKFPIAPNRKLFVLNAILLGLIVGLLIVFISEFYSSLNGKGN